MSKESKVSEGSWGERARVEGRNDRIVNWQLPTKRGMRILGRWEGEKTDEG
ncbi:MAG: hypothetical protein JSV88_32620 [Candidatus Aminicenantes bacterium]|nr:MAG: hypothetical protein JSV88_32620 [Candidatus Aminicenantes bacterium]